MSATWGNPHVVKVVTDAKDCALYFSRALHSIYEQYEQRSGRVPAYRPVIFRRFPAHLHPTAADNA